jgi:hypothetical protein
VKVQPEDGWGVILRVAHNQKMDSESDEEFDEDDDVIEKPIEIIRVNEEFEVENGLLGLKQNAILKLTTPMNGEDELKNLFGIGKEMSVIKGSKLFKMLRYFPPILEIKNGQPVRDDDDYEIRGNREFIWKEFIMQFIIDFKMYKNTGIYRLKSVWYPFMFYSLGIGLIEYVNWIYYFMTGNHCCFYDSGVFENAKLHGYKFRIVREDKVTLELDTNKRTLHLFVNNVIKPLCITNLPLSCCFLIVSTRRVDRIEFKSLLHSFDPTYGVDFVDEMK